MANYRNRGEYYMLLNNTSNYEFIHSLSKLYVFTNFDSVSITLICISIITFLYIFYIIVGYKREKSSLKLPSGTTQELQVFPRGLSEENTKQHKETYDLEHVNVSIISDIHYAATRLHQKYYEDRCISLLQKCPEAVNHPKPPLMFTPFLRACWCGNARVIEYMLKIGADITVSTKEGDSPMFLAVYSVTKKPQAYDPTCINLLYQAGCDINKPKIHGYTPLHMAAKAGNEDLVRWLLAHGANPDNVTKCNKKPVDFANVHGHQKVVSLLTIHFGDETRQRSTLGCYKRGRQS
ncbi:ankyrin-2-like [Periplaneta americana]|uniref:ankyrin-2-like n=1 Tax=Periplaneta americana TaxID=6978 RepID=UPI0037E98EA7